jgi:hypothetical protein
MPQGRGRDFETDTVNCRQNRQDFCGFLGIAEFNFFIFKHFVDPFNLHLLEFLKKISMYRSRDI